MARLRIMSVNLLVDRADPGDLRRAIEDVSPDVVAVQELGYRLAHVVSETHPHGHLDPHEDGFGLGIATRHPVEVQPVALPTRSGWSAALEPAFWPHLDAPIEIVNAHLTNPIDWPWSASRAARRGQVAGLTERYGQRVGARVIVGDMNSTTHWREYKGLAALGTDAARHTRTSRATWSHFLAGPRWLRIDHAFVAGATPISTMVMRIVGTDHSALVVDIEV
jgi:endonuclease/exonuclease/phosphatase (EEP) superfamily protein YafD